MSERLNLGYAPKRPTSGIKRKLQNVPIKTGYDQTTPPDVYRTILRPNMASQSVAWVGEPT